MAVAVAVAVVVALNAAPPIAEERVQAVSHDSASRLPWVPSPPHPGQLSQFRSRSVALGLGAAGGNRRSASIGIVELG